MRAVNGASGLPDQSPLIIAHLNEPQAPLSGWVVVDSLVDLCAMGGTRMTESVTEEDICALARTMTVKLSIAGLRIGGAKAGIRAEPAACRGDLLNSFGRTVAPLLHGGIYLGSDLGLTHADRDAFMAAAGYDIQQLARATRLPVSWATLWAGLADITGFGVATAIITAWERDRLRSARRVVIQGFGTVGRSAARNLAAHGHSIVAVADIAGTVAAADGVPVDRLIEITDDAGTIDRARLPSSAMALSEPEAWLDVSADVLVLAAGGSVIREDNAHRVRAPLVVEGGNLCCTPQARQKLRAAGTIVLPDVVVNVGGAAATGCILTGIAPSGQTMEQLVDWLFDWVAGRIQRNCHDLLDIAQAQLDDPVPALMTAHQRSAAW